MGIFYTNVTLKNVDQLAVADHLKRNNRQAFVSPMVDGHVVVFDKESEDSDLKLQELAMELSHQYQSIAFAVLVHDGDVFYYWLYENGKLIDQYDSCPGYFDPNSGPVPPKGGNPQVLCRAFQAPNALDDVRDIFERVLRTAVSDDFSEEDLIGDEIHDVLAQALGLPLFAVDASYYSIANDSLPEDLHKESLILCGNQPRA